MFTRDGHLPVNDMVFVASPGVGVDNAAQLHVSPDHVYSTVAKNDLINITNLNTPTLDPIDPLGPNPAMPDFGGKVLQSDPGTSMAGLPTTTAHGEYWNRNNLSLVGMSRIIAGKKP